MLENAQVSNGPCVLMPMTSKNMTSNNTRCEEETVRKIETLSLLVSKPQSVVQYSIVHEPDCWQLCGSWLLIPTVTTNITQVGQEEMRNALLKLQKPTWQIPSTPLPTSQPPDRHTQSVCTVKHHLFSHHRHHLRYASVLKSVLAPVRCSATNYNGVDIETSMTLGVKGKNQDYGIVLTRGWAKNNKNKTIIN